MFKWWDPTAKAVGHFNIGDRVVIREDLVPDRRYGGVRFVSSMSHYGGMQAQIVYRDFLGLIDTPDLLIYGIDLDGRNYAWTEEMFEKVDL